MCIHLLLHSYHSLESDQSLVEMSYFTVNFYHQKFYQIIIDRNVNV